MESFIRELPIRVRWVGWEGDTYTLKRQGWQIFASENMSPIRYEKQIRLSIKAPDNKIMIYGELDIGGADLARGSEMLVERLCRIGIEMQTYRAEDRVHIHSMPKTGWDSMNSMLPCDGFASVDLGYETKSLADLSLFKYTEAPKEIYIPYSSVDECLNRALELQYPEQKIIKANLTQIEKPIIQAKIYALAA